MVRYLIILFVLLSQWAIAEEQESLEKRYVESLALTFDKFAQGEGESIWPRFHLADKPAVFHFRNGHVYAMGLNGDSSQWETWWVQRYPVLFCSQYPIVLAPIQPAFMVENQQVFVFSLDDGQDTSFLPLLTFIHERFHTYQFQFFDKEKIVEAWASDYQNIDILTWMELEHRLLTLFLQASDPKIQLEHLKNYLAVSQARRASLQPASIRWEDHQQKMEGLADYVSVKTFQVFHTIPRFQAEKMLLEMRNKKNKGLVSARDAVKERHYFVGAALGWALDFCGIKDWKSTIEKENISLQTLLENALGLENEEKQQRLLHVQESFDWIRLREQIRHQFEKAERESVEVIQAFAAQEGVVIHMGMPSGHMSTGGRHQKSYQVDRTKALVGDTSLSASQDQSWMLRFKSIPLVFEEQNGERMFKLNSDVILQLDEKKIALAEILQGPHVEMRFSSLALKNEYCELESKRSGKLCVEKGIVSLKFN